MCSGISLQMRISRKCSFAHLKKNGFSSKGMHENADSKTSKENGLASEWVHMGLKEDLCKKPAPQTSKENVFTPVCVRMRYLKEDLSEKAIPHTSQETDFSPVCVPLQVSKEEWSENNDPQTSQVNGFSLVCVHVYLFKKNGLKMLTQRLHKKMVSFQCVFTCDVSNGNV